MTIERKHSMDLTPCQENVAGGDKMSEECGGVRTDGGLPRVLRQGVVQFAWWHYITQYGNVARHPPFTTP